MLIGKTKVFSALYLYAMPLASNPASPDSVLTFTGFSKGWRVDNWTFFDATNPEVGIIRVGGIWANSTFPAEFIYNNLVIETNVIHSSHLYAIKKLLFLGSSCIYPKLCPQPMGEACLLSGYLEPTNEPYAVAKIAGIKMCQA